MAHVTRKHGNRGEHGNVASMAIQSHGGSGNRAGKTKVLGGSLLEGDVCCTVCLSRRRKRRAFWAGAAYVLCGIRGKNESNEAAIRGLPAQQLHSDSVLLFAFVADNQCF